MKPIFIGREVEKSMLRKAMDSGEAEMVAVIGWRLLLFTIKPTGNNGVYKLICLLTEMTMSLTCVKSNFTIPNFCRQRISQRKSVKKSLYSKHSQT